MEIIKNRLRHFCQQQTGTDLLEESQSVIVPDTHPDVLQIVGADGWLNIQEKSCSGNLLRIGGQVNCMVCYLPVEGKRPCSISVSLPFNFIKEIEGMDDNGRLLSSAHLLHVSASMLNPRKMMVRAQLQVIWKRYRGESVEYIENIKGCGEDGVHCLCESSEINCIADIIEKRLVLNDEIRLSSPLPDEQSIFLCKKAIWYTEDVKVLPGKIMIRGHIDALMTAMDDHGSFLGKSQYTVPFSQIVECDAVQPEDRVEVSYSPVREEIEAVTSPDQVTTMQFSFAAVTECLIHKKVPIHAVVDLFSTKWEMQSEAAILPMPNDGMVYSMQASVQEKMVVEGEATQVLGVSVTSESTLVHSGEKTLRAGFHITAVYLEADGTVMTAYRKAYAEAPCEEILKSGLCIGFPEEATAAVGREGELQIRFDAELRYVGDALQGQKVIAACAVDRTKPRTRSGHASLIVRKAEAGESVWSLAKACNTVPSVLASANKLGEQDRIEAGSLILIPFVSR